MPNPTAATLLRDVGLLADGPLPWGRPVPARVPGVFIIELPRPLPTAPIEVTRVGKWLERVPDLRLDGTRPTTKALVARIASFWLPGQVVLYIGATTTSISGRVAAVERTVLGDRRPTAGGHWLKVLTTLPTTRVWWAATDAVEEYEDALLSAFADAMEPTDRAGLPDEALILPFANLRRPTGERRATGITGSLLPEPETAPTPPRRVVVVPDGDADGARGEPPDRKRRIVAQPAPERIRRPPTPRAAALAAAAGRGDDSTARLTPEGAARMRAELAGLTGVKRPEVIARIRAAKELGDLKENADYTAAREEQSFLEGRIQALEGRLRDAVVVDAPTAGALADLGSRVTVDVDGLTDTYTLVGSAEADPASGRLSVASPVGRALLGAAPGTEVGVETPRGRVVYRVVAVE
ncbi:MAG: transcription elongation factor GreA [Chloroflexota bacterium]